jgi:hypothetical protein
VVTNQTQTVESTTNEQRMKTNKCTNNVNNGANGTNGNQQTEPTEQWSTKPNGNKIQTKSIKPTAGQINVKVE